MSLHIESRGAGAPLLLIHGWGMHCDIWGSVVTQLAQHFRVHCVDLPGYGASPMIAQYDLDGLVQRLSEYWHTEHDGEPLALCGWSLGGQIALRWALHAPHQVDKLVLVATTPSFVQRSNWECAMDAHILQEFSVALLENHALTLKRFMALQVRGSEHERELLADLRVRLSSRAEPNIAALRGGLEILRNTDLRAVLPQITQAALVISGERDVLTSPAASNYLAQQLPNAQLFNIKGASHAPFLSHPEIFMQRIEAFLNG
ncbi:pimeloyl-ACP methyl ester esterase BioH [Candidatus Nitrotoga sp. M5]|uniref:pimeloyl-ACP methyl ester esterase BioH n=1 Tax=Candidatus Nitrotoga sp. M5 TaxID=2890409 RepID=UPI001EF47050|nr:pimeloyl-ACP methyl ester esterase BioH [Candidatus Nitrotoga sp. M5]CAH1387358.1 Pimeloyl-(acyl-carrier protein) methyl ester esterase [Candidatus Nitrotoga sp. M5]